VAARVWVSGLLGWAKEDWVGGGRRQERRGEV
jgi:hypothetical protein